jgi:hypothetical protein
MAMTHIYTERLGYDTDLELLLRYMDIRYLMSLIIDNCPCANEVITELLVDEVQDDKNVDPEVKVIE